MTQRIDRTNSSLRALSISQAVLSRADGSAKFSFGSVTALGSVSGPSEVRIRDEIVDRARLEINVLPLRQAPGPHSKSLEASLAALLTPLLQLHLHPRSLIQLTLQTLSTPTAAFLAPLTTDPALSPAVPPPTSVGLADGLAERAALVNAAMLAILDAAIEAEGVLVAVALARVHDELRLDPSAEEEAQAESGHGFVFKFTGKESEGECVGIDSVGTFDEDELFEAQETAQTAARAIYAFMRKSIEVRYGVDGPVPVKTEVEQMDTQ